MSNVSLVAFRSLLCAGRRLDQQVVRISANHDREIARLRRFMPPSMIGSNGPREEVHPSVAGAIRSCFRHSKKKYDAARKVLDIRKLLDAQEDALGPTIATMEHLIAHASEVAQHSHGGEGGHAVPAHEMPAELKERFEKMVAEREQQQPLGPDRVASDELDMAFEALRRISARVSEMEDPDHELKPPHIQLDVGQIFRHRKHGYRGVIVQWYTECPLDDEWVQRWGPFQRGRDQPFYQTMIDTKDRPRGLMTFAAEENLIPLKDRPTESDADVEEAGYLCGRLLPIEHPLFEKMFQEGSPVNGRHILQDHVQKDFPEDF